MHLADGPHEFVRRGVFEQVARRARFDGRNTLLSAAKLVSTRMRAFGCRLVIWRVASMPSMTASAGPSG